jgi:hypothetical protein
MGRDGFLIGELAQRTGVSRRALRLYEARGIRRRRRPGQPSRQHHKHCDASPCDTHHGFLPVMVEPHSVVPSAGRASPARAASRASCRGSRSRSQKKITGVTSSTKASELTI